LRGSIRLGAVVLRGSGALAGQCRGVGRQQVQFVGPELLDEIPKRAHAHGVEAVVPVPSVLARSHEAGLLQQQQVLGNSGAADREVGGELPHRLFAACQKMQQPTAVRFRGDLQGIQHR